MEHCEHEKFNPNTLQSDIRVLTERLMSFRDYASSEFKLFRELQQAVTVISTKCDGRCFVYDGMDSLIKRTDQSLRSIEGKIGESDVRIKNVEEDTKSIFSLIEKAFGEIRSGRELCVSDIKTFAKSRREGIWKSFNILLVTINVVAAIVFSILMYLK